MNEHVKTTKRTAGSTNLDDPIEITSPDSRLAKSEADRLLGEVAGELLDQISRGEQPQVEEYAKQYPKIAHLIRETFPALRMVQDVVGDGIASSPQLAAGGIGGEKQIGDFRLLHQLGSGGMGVVYEAEQVSIGRRVALKILPMAGALQQKQLLRFRNEVRAAAMLDHPHIVSVYSIGEERGVHFYAMQLIRGQSLAEVIRDLRLVREGDGGLGGNSIHQVISESERRGDGARGSADQPTEDSARPQPTAADATVADGSSKPTTDTRPEVKAQISTAANSNQDQGFFRSVAKLGIQAAEALEHAHELGVLHRDIKPGNLMLDADAQLFVTDFGLARIEADAGVTMTGDILGTLRYMSPEQAMAKRVVIDQRSDIYSLGVTLYELLTLQPAFAGNDRQSLLQEIAFEEPKLPTRINRAIPRELETIVMKAMAKNPRERYATAQELADDLGRYLDDMPIIAKPPTRIDRTVKWCRRHRSLVWSIAIACTLLLVTSVIVLTVSNSVIAREREVAHEKSAIAAAVIDFINEDLLASANPLKNPDQDVKVREVVDLAASQVSGRFAKQPLVAAGIHMSLGRTYQALGDYDSALAQYQEALKLYADQGGFDSLASLNCRRQLAVAYLEAGNDIDAEIMLRGVMQTQLQTLGDSHPDTLKTMREIARLCRVCGRMNQAKRFSRHVLECRSADLGPADPLTLQAKHDHAVILLQMGEVSQSLALLSEVLESREQDLGPSHPDSLETKLQLASLHLVQGESQLAQSQLIAVLKAYQDLLGDEHPLTLQCMQKLAMASIACDDLDRADRLLSKARDAVGTRFDQLHPIAMQVEFARGTLYGKRGQYTQSRDLLSELLDNQIGVYGKRHASVSATCMMLARAYEALHEDQKAAKVREMIVSTEDLYHAAFYLMFHTDPISPRAREAKRTAIRAARQAATTDSAMSE